MSPPSSAPSAVEGHDLSPAASRRTGADRVDRMSTFVPVRAGVGLGACVLLAAGVVTWALTAEIAQTGSAHAVSLVNGVATRIESPTDGIVTSLPVHPGAAVQAGQSVAGVRTATGAVVSLDAPIDGVVLNVNELVGSTTTRGDAIVSVEAADGPRQLRMFVPPTLAEHLHVGTRAVIEFPGQPIVEGRVSLLGGLPITHEQAAESLGSPALADLLLPDESTVAVTVLPDDPAALPVPQPGVAGTGRVALVRLVVDTSHPIDWVLR